MVLHHYSTKAGLYLFFFKFILIFYILFFLHNSYFPYKHLSVTHIAFRDDPKYFDFTISIRGSIPQSFILYPTIICLMKFFASSVKRVIEASSISPESALIIRPTSSDL